MKVSSSSPSSTSTSFFFISRIHLQQKKTHTYEHRDIYALYKREGCLNHKGSRLNVLRVQSTTLSVCASKYLYLLWNIRPVPLFMHTVEQKQECSKFLFCIINKQRTCLVTYTIIQLVNTYGLGSFYKIWVFNPNFYWEEIKVGVLRVFSSLQFW